jgi:predicted GIY-YIG superfamily endonuclease
MNVPKASRSSILIYVLQLEHGCFYVGQSKEFARRLERHFAGKGCAWTKLHRPIRLLSTRPAETEDWKRAEQIENQLTLSLMREHGWQRVRGGYWSATSEDATRSSLRHHGAIDALAMSRPLAPVECAPPVVTLPTAERRRLILERGTTQRRRKWSEDEDLVLAREFHFGVPLDQIAHVHGRS